MAHYQPHGTAPMLFMSPHAALIPGQAIRGGIPLCWPWFGKVQEPAHGFARIRTWDFTAATQLADGRTRLVFELCDDPRTHALWPYAFLAQYAIVVGATLELTLTTSNRGTTAFVFEDALHTYFNIGDIRTTVLEGLSGKTFTDTLLSPPQTGAIQGAMDFHAETCRIFQNDPSTCAIHDPGHQRRIVIEKLGARSTVVWTPWEKTASTMQDLGDAWPGFLCVESANCREGAITLEPGARHSTQVVYKAEPFMDHSLL